MARKSPQDTADKWAKNLKGSTEEIRKGVDRVTEAPGIAAAAKVEKMKQRLVASIDDGTWEERVSSVSLEEWKRKTKEKGINRISAGVDAANGKVVDFHNQLADHQETIDRELDSMPDITLEDGIARSAAQIRSMSKFKFRR